MATSATSLLPLFRRWLAPAALLATVLPAAAAPSITKFPVSQTATLGQAITFTVEATGTAPLSYQWYRGAAAIPAATAATYTIPAVTAADAGVYAIAVTDATGTTRTFTGFSPAFAAGSNHSLFVKTDGTLWAAGYNGNGQLGDGTFNSRAIPVLVATNVVSVAANGNHSLFIKTDGTLWGMGNNASGQLGDGTTLNRTTPIQIASGVAAAAAGTSHSLFLKTDGTLWAMGLNNNGQLGDGTGTARSSPVQIASGVQSIAAGYNHSLFIKTDGTLWAMGLNNAGQLGDGSTTSRLSAVQVASAVASVRAGNTHTLFLKTDGTAWGMGNNGSGQLGDGTFALRPSPVQVMTGVAAINAGGAHSFFLKSNGTLWASGYNFYGQLGDSTTATRSSPVQVAAGVTAMSGGDSFSFILRTDGTLWACGYNGLTQLGDGTGISRLIPAPVVLPTDTPAILSVTLPPTITDQTQSQTITAGTNVTLSVTAAGTPNLSYQWSKDSTPLPGATGPVYTISSFSIDKTGAYTVAITNSAGSVTSQPIVLDLTLPISAGSVGAIGRDLGLQATTGGASTVFWQVSTDAGQTWTTLNDGTDYSGTHSATLRILSAPAQTTGRLYRYTVTDGIHSATSASTSVTVFTSPLTAPSGIAIDRSGNLVVTDAAAANVVKIAPDLRLTVIAGKRGQPGSADGVGESAQFDEPTGLIIADDGTVSLTDASNSTIRVISPNGATSTFAGHARAFGADDGDNPGATFNIPTAITADITGTYVIADQMNHTIRTSTGGKVYTLAGRAGVPGFSDGTGSGASFFMPAGLAVRRDPFGSISWTGGNNGYGMIFVSDQGNNTIRVISNNGQVGTYIGNAGQAGTTNGFRTTARLNKPTGLAFDGDGNLYIADTGNHTIRKVTQSGTVSTYAGIPTVSGLMDGPGNQALFNAPEGVAVDSARNVYVTDTGNGVIRKITPTGVVSTLLVLGNVPVINSQPASQSVGPGGSVSFTVSATGEGPLTYQWRKDGQPIPNATAASYQVSPAGATNAGTYTVLVTNSWGSTESMAATLTISSTPNPPANTGGNASGSAGSSGGGGGAPSWDFLGVVAVLALIRRCFPGRGRNH
jgi:alpha-tubulin suppressor-like RCC1 family protein/sugar lactone lactonase YvrE